jgi:hypothetical protein
MSRGQAGATVTGRARALARGRATALALAVCSAALPAAVSAQSGEWPTLQRAAIEYISRSGGVQVSLSGQLDLEAIHVSNSWSGLVSLEGGADILESQPEDCSACHGDEPLRSGGGELWAHRLRLFTDIFLGKHVYSLVELRSDRGESPTDGKGRARVEQALVRVGNEAGTRWLQAGLFASPFGSYPLRHLSVVDPFVRPPLAYDYRTVMSRVVVPPDAARLLEWKHEPEDFRRTGVPPVWDVPYQWGAMAFVQVAGVDVRAAAMNSAPSSAPDKWWPLTRSRLADPTWVLAARAHPTIDLEVGVSWSKGPWMEEFTVPTASARGFRDFDQEIVAVDAAFARGATMVRGEAVIDRWAVPNVAGRPTEVIYQIEAQRDLVAGAFAAARVGRIDFRPVTRPGQLGSEDWDHDVTRLEASLGYRLARNAGILLSGYEQLQSGASDAEGRLVGARLWWAF